MCQLTNHGLELALRYLNELLVDLDGEVAQHLAVLGQVKVLQAVLVLLRCVLRHETLSKRRLKLLVSLFHLFTVPKINH